MKERLSIIIPALNEANSLPLLLRALQEQTRLPDEIIVADAGSKDETQDLALAAGALVAPGGMPAVGRNAGARAATGDIFLFLDADVRPGPTFLASLLNEFEHEELVVATCLIQPLSERASDWFISEITNLYLQIMQHISPHAPGFCILVRREVHEAIAGFDESLVMAEDHDYVQRAASKGLFGVLTKARIPVSVRRLEKEGLVRLAIKYLYCELHALARKPIRSTPFEYEFGDFAPGELISPGKEARSGARRLVDVAWLRQKLDDFENPLSSLTEQGKAGLQALGSINLSADAFEQRLYSLMPAELSSLRRYLNKRLDLLQASSGALRSRLKQLPERTHRETIRLVETEWRRIFRQAPSLEEPPTDDETASNGDLP